MKATGLSWSTIQRAKKGERDFDLSVAVRICIATGGAVPVSALSSEAALLDQLAVVLATPRRRRDQAPVRVVEEAAE